MRFTPTLALASLWHVYAVSALNVEGHVAWNSACRDINELHPTTKVSLDGGKYKGFVRQDGRFTLFDVAPGSYVLEVLARDHVFDLLRVDVLPETSSASTPVSTSTSPTPSPSSTSASEDSDAPPLDASPEPQEPQPRIQVRLAPPGTPFHAQTSPHHLSTPLLPYPIVLEPKARKIYEVPAEGFDFLGMFKNPMMMMMLAAGIMIFAMPKILEKMDPELVKDMTQRQDTLFNMQNSLQSGDFGSLKKEFLKQAQDLSDQKQMGGISSGSGTAAAVASSPSGKKSGGGKKKR